METGFEANWQFKEAVVHGQHQYVPRGVQDCGAYFAGFEVALDVGELLRSQTLIKILRNFFPDVPAVQFHERTIERKAFLGSWTSRGWLGANSVRTACSERKPPISL